MNISEDYYLLPTCKSCQFAEQHRQQKKTRILYVRNWDIFLMSLMTKHIKRACKHIVNAMYDKETLDYFKILMDIIESEEKKKELIKNIPKPPVPNKSIMVCTQYKPKIIDNLPVTPDKLMTMEDKAIMSREKALL